MGSIGWYLIIFGLASGGLSFLDSEFVLLSWIGTWGEGIAWFLRAGIVIVGWVLIELERRNTERARQQQEHVGPLG